MTFSTYLDAKRELDDRSIHPFPSLTFTSFLNSVVKGKILDVGCGNGANLHRLQRFLRGWEYHALDNNAQLLRQFRQRWPYTSLVTHQQHFEDFISNPAEVGFNAIIAHMFLDLVAVEPSLQALLGLLLPGGMAYFSMVYNGSTQFIPAHPSDDIVIYHYHQSMKQGRRDGAGAARAALRYLSSLDAPMNCHPSDWIIFPQQRKYVPGQQEVGEFILECIEKSVFPLIEAENDFKHWISLRRNQLSQGQLSIIISQLDLIVQKK